MMMTNYTVVLLILIVMVVLSAFSDKIRIPYPVLLVLTGIVIGFIPKLPYIEINSEIIFLIFLPPLLYDAAFNISFSQFKTHFSTIRTLAFPLVFLTAGGIALFAHYLIPGMSWPLSFVLGAILSATDAVAAIGITKNLGLSHKATTILEGESLINDASSLVAYRFAISALAGASFVFWKAGLQFVILLAGGFAIGVFIARVMSVILQKVKSNSVVTICFMLLSPFVTYLIAEEIHVSGVIAVVVLGFGISRYSNQVFPAALKQQSQSIWEIIIFLLNGLIFILIGLQFPYVFKSISNSEILPYLCYALLISIIAFVIRMYWIVLQQKRLQDLFEKGKGGGRGRIKIRISKHSLLDIQTSLIICWGGIRGIIPLAIALGLPATLADGSPFPQRNAIVFITVMVVLLTIIIQGLTLPWLVKRFSADEGKQKTAA
jgi:monovalent cation/hydrogen antiporter